MNSMPGKKPWRFVHAWETGLISAFVGYIVWFVISSAPLPEASALKRAYGPARHSEGVEEWTVRDFFHDRRDGFFLDVGANHFKTNSNTFFLEDQLGWSGIAVEPLRGFEPDYQKYRPHTKFRAFFVSDVSNQTAKMYLLDKNHLVTSSDKSFTETYGSNPHEITVPTVTLNDLLDADGVRTIDYLSMDIELSEPKALAGFDIERFRPQLVCIEAHPQVRQQILDYFMNHGYVLVGRYLRADPQNLYFTPFRRGGEDLSQAAAPHSP